MSVRSLSACLMSAALVLAGVCLQATAKPPDLPVQSKVICQPAMEVEVDGIGCSTVETAASPAEEEDASAKPGGVESETVGGSIDTFSPFFCEFLRKCGEAVAQQLGGPAVEEAESGTRTVKEDPEGSCPDSKPKPVAPAQPSQLTCPYLQQQEAQKKALPAGTVQLGSDVLENLNKLEEASRIYREAEQRRRDGQIDTACRCYEQVKQLCPGSRYDGLARSRLQELQAMAPSRPHDAGAEEEENPPEESSKPQQQSRANGKCLETRVAELLEACQRAYAEGYYARARSLADKALALDAGCVAANALVYKTHLLTQLQEKKASAVKSVERASGGVWIRSLWPSLPAVDAHVVSDFERILSVKVEEIGVGEEEESLESSTAENEEMLMLFVDPPVGDLFVVPGKD